MTRCCILIVAIAVGTATACVRVQRPQTEPTPMPPGATLWRQPANIAAADLFHGPWGSDRAPDPNGTYTLVEIKHSGVNPGMTVRDARGREWSVKQAYPGSVDPEGPVEVVVSRLLSSIGYHQPPVYFLPAFTLKDDFGTHTEIGGRFRLKEEGLDEVDSWSWQENPFIGSKPYQGLLVLMMMLNATDLKNSNNSLYEYRRRDGVERWYVARDVGAALGDTERYAPRKGHPSAFERHPFIVGVNKGYVEFAYDGWYQKLVENRITPADVKWASDLLGRLTERQWRDAFRAGGYEPDVANRFIRTLRDKIEQGRSGRFATSARSAADTRR